MSGASKNLFTLGEYVMTHAQIGEAIGMNGPAVKMLERRAIEKCRHICVRRGITFTDLIDHLKVGDAWEAVD